MAQENPNTPDITEEAQANAEEQGTPDAAAAPALNRAQRRAQAHGKSGAAGSSNTASRPGSQGGAANRAAGHAGQVRFPRTGHK